MNISLLNIYFNSVKNNNSITKEISQASLKIEPFKTVLPINNSDYWLHNHISNYLGIDKPMIILENYEASLDHFPLKWNRNKIPNLYFGNMSPVNECLSWVSNINNDISVIDYIFILNGEKETLSDSCKNNVSGILAKDYMEVYRSKDNQVLLYRYLQNN